MKRLSRSIHRFAAPRYLRLGAGFLIPLMAVSGSLRAAPITWTTKAVESPAADVSTSGVLVGAMNVGDNKPYAFNGVDFAAETTDGEGNLIQDSDIQLGYATLRFTFGGTVFNNNFWTGPAPGGSADYGDSLDYARNFDGSESGSLILGNLTEGTAYQVQLWIADTRTFPSGLNNRRRTIDGTVQMISGPGPHIATGTFVADSTSQSITIAGQDGYGPQLNLLQLREIPLVGGGGDFISHLVVPVGGFPISPSGSPGSGTNYYSVAQAFDTGNQTARLGSITVNLRRDIDNPSDAYARVRIFSDDGDKPATLVEDLGVIVFTTGFNFNNHTIESTSRPILAKDTRYWVVVSNETENHNIYWASSDTGAPTTGSGSLPTVRAVITDATTQWKSFPLDGSTSSFRQIMAVAPYRATALVTSADNGGEGSLRKAIADIPTGGTIRFDPSLSGETITLTTGQLLIDKDLTIDASELSRSLTIDANGKSRIFEIKPGSTVALHGLTLTGGVAGGAGSPDNSGGAIFSDHATLSLTACTLSGNSALFGGGIFSDGRFGGSATLSLTACTLSGNSAAFGGGIHNNGYEGSATLSLTACTFSGNSASFGGGIYSDSRVSGSATLSLHNSILAANSAPTGPDLREIGDGAVTTATGQNLLSSSEGSNISSAPLPDGITVDTDPLLAPLGWYGGPTQTMHPLAGSPAILTGQADTTRTDQRGFELTGPPTIGAVKLGSVTTVTDTNDTGEGSLRQALAENAFIPGRVIRFADNLSGGTIELSSAQLEIPDSATGLFIDASNLPAGLTIDANGSGATPRRVLKVNPRAVAALQGLTLTGGVAGGGDFPDNSGGAIFSDHATLSLTACTLSGNSALFGGGIFSDGYQGSATLSLTACTLSGNSASSGGGIFSDGTQGSASLSLHNSILAANSAPTGPDLRETGDGAVTTATGQNLLSSTDGHGAINGGTVLVDDPFLAPLGDYGGPTLTMPPLPGSPAIDVATGSILPTDQRGFPRVGSPDIGAAEYRGASDLALFWGTDWDGDGRSFGLEQAVGTDPKAYDSGLGKMPLLSGDASGLPLFTFGRGADAAPGTVWVVTRSPDLSPGSFKEIYRFGGGASTPASPDGNVGFEVATDSFSITDKAPLPGSAFYRLEVITE